MKLFQISGFFISLEIHFFCDRIISVMGKNNREKTIVLQGIEDGFPIGLGYFAVAFSLGIIAKDAGVTPLQCFITSFLNHASAGEYAIFTCIRDGVTYIEIALMVFIANIRYVLMSCALSQRIKESDNALKRFLIGFTITDEIFAVEIGRPGYIDFRYPVTMFIVASIMWSSGSSIGCFAGNILPLRVVSALSVALYGMFLAIIIPPARKNRIIMGAVVLSFGLSYLFTKIPVIRDISSGTRIIILTVLISSIAAILFPVKDEDTENNNEAGEAI